MSRRRVSTVNVGIWRVTFEPTRPTEILVETFDGSNKWGGDHVLRFESEHDANLVMLLIEESGR